MIQLCAAWLSESFIPQRLVPGCRTQAFSLNSDCYLSTAICQPILTKLDSSSKLNHGPRNSASNLSINQPTCGKQGTMDCIAEFIRLEKKVLELQSINRFSIKLFSNTETPVKISLQHAFSDGFNGITKRWFCHRQGLSQVSPPDEWSGALINFLFERTFSHRRDTDMYPSHHLEREGEGERRVGRGILSMF